MKKELNICGLISMILGIISLFIFPLWLGIASLVLGIVGICTAKENKGKGMAIAGTATGAASLLWVLFFSALVAV